MSGTITRANEEVLREGEIVPPGLFKRGWDRLDAPLEGRSVPGTYIIAGLAVVVGIIITAISFKNDWMLLYFDARSHLTIARSIIDSQNPGFYQLGTVWLPAPHVLLIPFTAIFPLWQTGLAAAILGIACLAASTAAIWRIAYRVGFNRPARIVAVAVFLFNPTMLYLSTTAMTEPVLMASWLLALAGLVGWITAMPAISPGALTVFAGIPTTVAVMSRYEGWAFMACATVFIIVAAWRRWRSIRYTLILLMAYLAVPVASILWWLTYNYVRYGNPLEFAFGPYSAGADAKLRESLGVLPQKGNLGLSLTIYDTGAINIIGWPILIMAVAGGVVFLWTRGFSTTALIVWIPLFTYPFILLSLYLGQIVIINEHAMVANTMYNNRYAGETTAIVALLCAALVDVVVGRFKRVGRSLASIAVAIAIGFAVWSFADGYNRMIILREGFNSTVAPNAVAAGNFIRDNYDGGYVLIEAGSRGDSMLVGLTNDQVITVDNGPIFEATVKDPSSHVEWIMFNTALVRDSIWTTLKDDAAFNARFSLVYEAAPYRVYQNHQRPGEIQ